MKGGQILDIRTKASLLRDGKTGGPTI